MKLALVAVLGVAKAGWYAILKGRLYAALRDRRGTARAIGDTGAVAGSLLPLGVGLIARAVGRLLDAAPGAAGAAGAGARGSRRTHARELTGVWR